MNIVSQERLIKEKAALVQFFGKLDVDSDGELSEECVGELVLALHLVRLMPFPVDEGGEIDCCISTYAGEVQDWLAHCSALDLWGKLREVLSLASFGASAASAKLCFFSRGKHCRGALPSWHREERSPGKRRGMQNTSLVHTRRITGACIGSC